MYNYIKKLAIYNITILFLYLSTNFSFNGKIWIYYERGIL